MSYILAVIAAHRLIWTYEKHVLFSAILLSSILSQAGPCKALCLSNFHSLFLSVYKTGSVPINIYKAGKEFEFIVPLETDTMVLLIYSNYCPTL